MENSSEAYSCSIVTFGVAIDWNKISTKRSVWACESVQHIQANTQQVRTYQICRWVELKDHVHEAQADPPTPVGLDDPLPRIRP